MQPIEITRHLGFCLGNAVKYVLRAPFKGGEEDCRKALQYLEWEEEDPQPAVTHRAYTLIAESLEALQAYLVSDGDALWNDVAGVQSDFLTVLDAYLLGAASTHRLAEHVADLARILSLRDRQDPAYAGCTGRPDNRRTS